MPLLETLGALGGSALLGAGGSLFQNMLGKDNLQYQWDEMYSPQAQVRNLAKAGINPAVAFGNNSPTFTSGGQLQMPNAPDFGIGTTAINELGNYFKSLADAKKAGADTKYVGAMTDKALTEIEAQKMQNEFTKRYGNQKWLNDLSLSYQYVLLAQKTNDMKEIEKAIGKWKEASEKAISEANEHQRDMLAKDLANKDEQIKLSNNLLKEKAKTEQSTQTANYASASNSRELRRLNAALADVEEGGKSDKIKSLIAEYKKNEAISDADAKEAEVKLSRLESIQDKRSSTFFREVDNYLEWLKDKVRIFH